MALTRSAIRLLIPDIGGDNQSNRISWVTNQLAQIRVGQKVLDAGAGTQPYRSACSHLQYVSQDFAGYDGIGDGRGLQTEQFEYGALDHVCDIACIPEPDSSFDVVLCTEVLEHIPRPEAALQEFYRLLRPGGRLILTAPFCSITHLAPYHFSTGFSRYWYEQKLPEIGFRIQELTPNGGYFAYLAQEIRRLDSTSRQYAGEGLGTLAKLAALLLLASIKQKAKREKGSSELLCFGWHVVAAKPLKTESADQTF